MTTPVPADVALVSIFCSAHQDLAGWYRRVFGFREIESLTTPIFVALAAGPIALGFHHDDAYDLLGVSDDRFSRGTKIHLTLAVDGDAAIDAAHRALAAHGATIVREPFTTYYGARQIVFRDPEGNLVRISTPQAALDLSSEAGV
jgi:catechol 2,3-dioxygenase-like lactoylglutathione lyase family enzyme